MSGGGPTHQLPTSEPVHAITSGGLCPRTQPAEGGNIAQQIIPMLARQEFFASTFYAV